jgi:hypothetical protein
MTSGEMYLLIEQRPDARGECDECHREPVELWTDYDEPGEFQFCHTCWLKFARRAERIERRQRTEANRVTMPAGRPVQLDSGVVYWT